MSDSFVTPWIVAHQAPLSMAFPRKELEYWSGMPFSSLGDLPNPGIQSVFPVAGELFTTEQPGKPLHGTYTGSISALQYLATDTINNKFLGPSEKMSSIWT